MKKIINIKRLGKRPVYDISVEDNQQYILENGVVSHNTGSYYGADNIWILGRQQEKDGNEISGYNFIINIEKSRYVKEKSKIPINVSFEEGINKWSGLFDLAIEAGYIAKPKQGWYCLVNQETGELDSNNKRANQMMDDSELWKDLLYNKGFDKWLEKKYSLAFGDIIKDNDDET